MKAWRFVPVVALAFFGLFVTTGAASATPASASHTYTCSGGNVPAGTYHSIVVTGVCYMPAGTIVVRDDLTVAPGALLDATAPGDPAANPLVPATVLVGGDVSVGKGAVLLLGCSPNIACPQGVTYDRIGGDLTAKGALGVVVHNTTIAGDFSLVGGGGGVIGPPLAGACFAAPLVAPWSLDPALNNPTNGSPVYSDSEDNVIGGDLSIIGVQSCWLGALRNQVGGDATVRGNTMSDPDAMEVNMNLVRGDMTCRNNLPAVQFGEGGTPNMVGESGHGECGFNVIDPNPAPEANPSGPTVNEHIAVSTDSLRKRSGTHTQTANVGTTVFGTTTSNNTLVGAMNSVVLAGNGLTGTVKEQVLSTVYPNGSDSFNALDTCACTFQGKTGNVQIRAYGTTSKNGLTRGTFLVTGAQGNLATLAGYGTFTSDDQPAGTLRLVEHLRIT